MKATIATLGSVTVSVAVVSLLVPMMGGHPDGPGFWMSILCPLLIAGPASTWQFHQKDLIVRARNELVSTHAALELAHQELGHLHRALDIRARTDALTGGLNREAIFRALEQACRAPTGRMALLVADADHFKQINDVFGHLGGDEALRAIGHVIASNVGPRDRWGRIGGEEFMIMLLDVDEQMAAERAEAIRSDVAGLELVMDRGPMPLTLSIGLAFASGPIDPLEFYRRADRNLYGAKNSGRNRVFFQDHDRQASA